MDRGIWWVQSMVLQRVRHDWDYTCVRARAHTHTHTHTPGSVKKRLLRSNIFALNKGVPKNIKQVLLMDINKECDSDTYNNRALIRHFLLFLFLPFYLSFSLVLFPHFSAVYLHPLYPLIVKYAAFLYVNSQQYNCLHVVLLTSF